MHRIIAIAGILAALFSSCDEADYCPDLVSTTWEIESYSLYRIPRFCPKESNKYISLTFVNDSLYYLCLEVNGCAGNYSIEKNNHITISPMWCTEICCDSDYSMEILRLLPHCTSFTYCENCLVLRFPAKGEIRLKSVSD